jgi:hypothetical protein
MVIECCVGVGVERCSRLGGKGPMLVYLGEWFTVQVRLQGQEIGSVRCTGDVVE